MARRIGSAGMAPAMNDERVDRLEERLAWLQRHVTEQDKAMLGLAEEIGQLRRELAELRRALDGESAGSASPDERPPHY